MAVNEELISLFEIILAELLELSGSAENTRIDLNLTVVDAAPAAPLTDYIIVAGGPGGTFNGPALKVPGLTYTNGDKVNVIFKKGTEPVAYQHGSGSSGFNSGFWQKESGTDDIYYNAGIVSAGDSSGTGTHYSLAAGDASLHIRASEAARLLIESIQSSAAADVLSQIEFYTVNGLGFASASIAAVRDMGDTYATHLSFRVTDAGGNPLDDVLRLTETGTLLLNKTTSEDAVNFESSSGFSVPVGLSMKNDFDTTSARQVPIILRHSNAIGAQIIAERASGDSDGMELQIYTEPVGGSVTERGGFRNYGPLYLVPASLPGSPQAGDIAIDSGDSNGLKWYDGSNWRSSSKPYQLWESDGGAAVVEVDATGNVVFNDSSADRDWRMESNNNANMLFLDGGNDVVIIGGATQQTSGSTLEVHDTDDGYVTLYNSGDTSAERGMYLRWNHSNGLGAQIGAYRASGDSDGMNMVFATEVVSGSITEAMRITSDQVVSIGRATPSPGWSLEVGGNGGIGVFLDGSASINIYSFRNNAFMGLGAFRSARGTEASPSAVQSGDILGRFGALGYHSSSAYSGVAASFNFLTEEGFTSSANGCGIDFQTTAAGGTTLSSKMRLYGSGGLVVGAATGANKGAGTINVASNIYLNNSAYTNPDFVLEKYLTGKIERFKENPGAAEYQGLLSLDKLRGFLTDNLHLPGRDYEIAGVVERFDLVQRWAEEIHLYILELHERLEKLEAKYV